MRHDKLFDAVAQPGDSPEKLAARLECEATAGKPFEEPLREEITAFRKLRTDARVSAARRYLSRPQTVVPMLELAKQFVQTSDDRRTNFLVVDDVKLSLGRHEHIIDAKAEWSDLVWAVQKILEAGRKP
jgi:hypothetical protein